MQPEGICAHARCAQQLTCPALHRAASPWNLRPTTAQLEIVSLVPAGAGLLGSARRRGEGRANCWRGLASRLSLPPLLAGCWLSVSAADVAHRTAAPAASPALSLLGGAEAARWTAAAGAAADGLKQDANCWSVA